MIQIRDENIYVTQSVSELDEKYWSSEIHKYHSDPK